MLKKWFTFIIILLLSIQSSFSNYNTILLQNSTSPDFEILFQNPSYVLEKEQNNKILYICDEEKSECKINLKLVQPWTTSSLSSNLSCEITTTFESEQFERCNPSSVIFPEGINSVNIKVTNKDDSENFSEYNFIIQNGEVDTDILESEKNKILQLLKPEVLENKDVGIPEVNIPIYSGEAIIKNIISGEVKIESTEEDTE